MYECAGFINLAAEVLQTGMPLVRQASSKPCLLPVPQNVEQRDAVASPGVSLYFYPALQGGLSQIGVAPTIIVIRLN